MRIQVMVLLTAMAAWGQGTNPDRVMNAYTDRAIAEQVTRLKTDERILMYQTMVSVKQDNLHYPNLLAGT